MASSNSRGLVLLLITSGFFITGLLFDYMPMIIDDHIKRTIELATNEEILSYWSRPPIDVHSYYWVYEVTNAEQFKTNGEKIQVRKVGPFHFTSRLEKRIIEISSNKYRVIYNSSRIMRLNDSYPGSEQLDEQITLLNPIYGSICEGARVSAQDIDPQQRQMIGSSINRLTEKFNETLFLNTSARVALLGRALPIVQTMKKLADTFGLDAKVPDILPNGKFGFVSLQNNTQMGPFEIYTGFQETAKSLGDLISYKGKKRMSYFDGRCNRLQASVGELRPMPIDPSEVLEMYSPNFCRIAHLKPTGVHKLREGMAVSYIVGSEDFMSADTNPDNRCFCINGTRDNYCSLNGAIDLAPCSYYSPVVLTVSNIQPDPKITGSIKNWDPELLRSDIESLPSNEMTQLLILKRLGVPVFADLTATLFMKIIKDPTFRQTANVPEISYIPLVMVRETASIPPRLGQIIVNLESFLALTYHIKVRSGSRSNGGRGGSSISAANTGSPDTSQAGGATGNLSSSVNGTDGGDAKRASRQLVDGQLAANGHPVSNGLIEQVETNEKALGEEIGQQQQRQQQNQPTASSGRANSASSNRSQSGAPAGSPNVAGQGDETTSGAAGLKSRPNMNRQDATSVTATDSVVDRQVMSESGGVISKQPARMKREASIGQVNSGTSMPASDRRGSKLNAAEGVEAPPGGRPIGAGVARIFSKVDEELHRLTGNLKQHTVSEPNGATRIELDSSGAPAGLQSENQFPSGEFNETLTDGEHHEQQQQQQELDDQRMAARKRSRKNWFMNVYSNFVRMLNGLRTTISDAGQLDVAENDYQDKQLEMLAGKIDNWYNGHPSPSSHDTIGEHQQQQQQSDGEPTEGLDSNNSGPNLAGTTPGPEEAATGADAGDKREPSQAPSVLVASPGHSKSASSEGDQQVPANLVAGQARDGDDTQETIVKTMIASTMTENPAPSSAAPSAGSPPSSSSTTIERDTKGPTKVSDANVGVSSGEFNENEPDVTSVAGEVGSVRSVERNRSLESSSAEPSNVEPTATTCRSDTSRSDEMTSANEAEVGPEDLQAEANSKATALEQIELALSNGNSSGDNAITGGGGGGGHDGQSHLGIAQGGAAGAPEESHSAGAISVNGADSAESAQIATTTTSTSATPSRPVMINSSTSIDSVINMAAISALSVSGNISSSSVSIGLNQSATQRTMGDDQIDESSSGGSLKQSSKWPPDREASEAPNGPANEPNGLTFGDQPIGGFNVESDHATMATKTASDAPTTNNNGANNVNEKSTTDPPKGQQALVTDMNSTITNDEQEKTTTTTTTTTTGSSNGKDERRDSGVKLDSRNGISKDELLAANGGTNADSIGHGEKQPIGSAGRIGTTTTTTTQTGPNPNQATIQNGNSLGDELNKASIGLAQSSSRKSSPKLGQQQQQQQQLKKQIKGIPNSNGSAPNGASYGPTGGGQLINGNRAKLLPNDGPNYNDTNTTNNNNGNANSNGTTNGTNGNNILNGKIMFQHRNGITSSPNQMATPNDTGNRLQPAGA